MSPESPITSSHPSPRTQRVVPSHGTLQNKEVMCYVTEADGKVHSVTVNQKVPGRELLRKIAKMLGFSEEADYFGLQYQTAKKETFWLNLRNRIASQLPGRPPYHLFLRAKFYVPPHRLLLEATRQQFYKNVAQHLTTGSWDQDIDTSLHATLIAIMTQVTFGNYNATNSPPKYVSFWPELWDEMPPQMEYQIAKYHRQIADSSITSLQYDLLQKAAESLRWYGNFFYPVEDWCGNLLILSVGPEGMLLTSSLAEKEVKQNYAYPRIQNVTVTDRVLALSVVEENHSIKNHGFQLSSRESANAIYRYCTEAHSFYHCSSVKEDVLRQTTDHIWMKLTHILLSRVKRRPYGWSGSEVSQVTADYMFDVLHTAREVQDNARRRLYHNQLRLADSVSETVSNCSSAGSVEKYPRRGSSTSEGTSLNSRDQEIQVLREQVNQLLAATQCCICLTNQIERVFYPCGHPVSCAECCTKLQCCPYCREPIQQIMHFFMTLPCMYHDVAPSSSASSSAPCEQPSEDETSSHHQRQYISVLTSPTSSGCDTTATQISMDS